jgi:hypothetical protein
MATHLTSDALLHVGNSRELQEKISPLVGVSTQGILAAVIRNSKSLTTYKAVQIIAHSMKKKPVEILEELQD